MEKFNTDHVLAVKNNQYAQHIAFLWSSLVDIYTIHDLIRALWGWCTWMFLQNLIYDDDEDDDDDEEDNEEDDEDDDEEDDDDADDDDERDDDEDDDDDNANEDGDEDN